MNKETSAEWNLKWRMNGYFIVRNNIMLQRFHSHDFFPYFFLSHFSITMAKRLQTIKRNEMSGTSLMWTQGKIIIFNFVRTKAPQMLDELQFHHAKVLSSEVRCTWRCLIIIVLNSIWSPTRLEVGLNLDSGPVSIINYNFI